MRIIFFAIAATVAANLVEHPARAVTFEVLGTVDYAPGEKSILVSDDGATVLSARTGAGSQRAFVWRLSQGIVTYYERDNYSPRGLSGDGKLIVGYHYSSLSGARDASYDGTVVVGYRILEYPRSEAVRSRVGESTIGLGDLPGGEQSSSATAVSADGSTVVGSSWGEDWLQPFRWTAEDGMTPLGLLPGATSPRGKAWDVSADGLAVVGAVSSSHGWSEAFRWTPESGLQGLGDFPGGHFDSHAYAISADGKTIVGTGMVEGPQGNRAFVWDETHGMRRVEQLLADAGIHQPRLALWSATGVSANGRVIVGWGVETSDTGAAGTVAWRLDLGPIPEPSCQVLLMTAGFCIVANHRRRKRSLSGTQPAVPYALRAQDRDAV
jgi:uncharacterized membrane protein